jgi:ACT domain
VTVTTGKRRFTKLVRMLSRQLLVRLPDRPGSLGQVTTLLGRLGVDIRQMRVIERDGVCAIDEFAVAVPGAVIDRTLPALLEEIAGVTTLSMTAVDPIALR